MGDEEKINTPSRQLTPLRGQAGSGQPPEPCSVKRSIGGYLWRLMAPKHPMAARSRLG